MRASSILGLNSSEAKTFFLKQDCYFSGALPEYFQFSNLLLDIAKRQASNTNLLSLCQDYPYRYLGVNYVIPYNKDGGYGWRPLQLIHPVLYINLVNIITKPIHWREIKRRLEFFSANPKIECHSMPIVSRTSRPQDEIMIVNWYHQVEQRTLKLALDYRYMAETDIANCYGEFHLGSLNLALRQVFSKQIELALRQLNGGSLIGLPQSGELTNFIAEIVLTFVDSQLASALESQQIDDYQILRYRDDYRIFANSRATLEAILKSLNNILASVHFRLNNNKTKITDSIISAATKPGKYHLITENPGLLYLDAEHDTYHQSLEKQFLAIHAHNAKFPQSGSTVRVLAELYEQQIYSLDHSPDAAEQMIAIVVDMMLKSPRLYGIGCAVISKLMMDFKPSEQLSIISKIEYKFKNVPNAEYLEIWLQRLSVPISRTYLYHSPLCQKLYVGNRIKLWNSDWLRSEFQFDENIIDESKLESISSAIPVKTVKLFTFDKNR